MGEIKLLMQMTMENSNHLNEDGIPHFKNRPMFPLSRFVHAARRGKVLPKCHGHRSFNRWGLIDMKQLLEALKNTSTNYL